MSLPTLFYGDEEDASEKTSQTFQCVREQAIFISQRLQKPGNEEVFAASKAFLQFCCSDEQLNEFTVEMGLKGTLNYTVTDETYEKLPYIFQKYVDLSENGTTKFVYENADNETFYKEPERNSMGYWGERIKGKGVVAGANGTLSYREYDPCFYQYFRENRNSKTCSGTSVFESKIISKAEWAGMSGPGTSKYFVNSNDAPVKFQDNFQFKHLLHNKSASAYLEIFNAD